MRPIGSPSRVSATPGPGTAASAVVQCRRARPHADFLVRASRKPGNCRTADLPIPRDHSQTGRVFPQRLGHGPKQAPARGRREESPVVDGLTEVVRPCLVGRPPQGRPVAGTAGAPDNAHGTAIRGRAGACRVVRAVLEIPDFAGESEVWNGLERAMFVIPPYPRGYSRMKCQGQASSGTCRDRTKGSLAGGRAHQVSGRDSRESGGRRRLAGP